MKKILLILSLLLILGVSTHAEPFKIRSKIFQKKRYLYLPDIAKFYGLRYSKLKKKSYLYASRFQVSFIDNDRRCVINKVVTYLSFAIWKSSNASFISETDFRVLLDPLCRLKALPKSGFNTVIIDAGHGGKDIGASGKHYKEKNITLSVALKLAKILKSKKYKVVMTRSSNKALTLAQRAASSQKYKNAIFVSIHANSAKSSVNGIETFFLTPVSTASTSSSKIRLVKSFADRFNKLNSRLAFEVQRNILYLTKASDRGIKHAKFYVLKNASSPAILVEMGFLSNKKDELNLGSKKYQNKIVTGIANGIISYHRALLYVRKHEI